MLIFNIYAYMNYDFKKREYGVVSVILFVKYLTNT